jgi:hypothetical protein
LGSTAEERREYWDNLAAHGMRAYVQVGIALRARLKTDNQEDLNVLWQEGGEGGFGDYEKDDHFFGTWSTERRKQLFAVGIDQMFDSEGKLTPARTPPTQHRKGTIDYADETENQTTNGKFYTRSFPILEKVGSPGFYGDELHAIVNENVAATDINFNIRDYNAMGQGGGWLYLWPREEGKRPDEEAVRANLGKGFFTGEGLSTVLFPQQTTLKGTSAATADIEYEGEYQWATTFRACLEYQNATGNSKKTINRGRVRISDTGLSWIWPRSRATWIEMHNVDQGPPLLRNPDRLQGDEHPSDADPLLGGAGAGIRIHKGEWLDASEERLTDKLAFDTFVGHNNDHNNIVYAPAPIPIGNSFTDANDRLGGISISKDHVKIADRII